MSENAPYLEFKWYEKRFWIIANSMTWPPLRICGCIQRVSVFQASFTFLCFFLFPPSFLHSFVHSFRLFCSLQACGINWIMWGSGKHIHMFKEVCYRDCFSYTFQYFLDSLNSVATYGFTWDLIELHHGIVFICEVAEDPGSKLVRQNSPMTHFDITTRTQPFAKTCSKWLIPPKWLVPHSHRNFFI